MASRKRSIGINDQFASIKRCKHEDAENVHSGRCRADNSGAVIAAGSVFEMPKYIWQHVLLSPILCFMDLFNFELVSLKCRKIMHDAWLTVKSLILRLDEMDDDRYTSGLILKVLSRCRNLEVVVLHLNSSSHEKLSSNDSLFQVLGGMPKLKKVDILFTQLHASILDSGVSMLANCTHLQKLCLTRSAATNAALGTIGRCLPKLLSLGLVSCWFVSDEGLMNLIDGCQALRELDVSYSKKITARGVQYFIQSYARLNLTSQCNRLLTASHTPMLAALKLCVKFSGVCVDMLAIPEPKFMYCICNDAGLLSQTTSSSECCRSDVAFDLAVQRLERDVAVSVVYGRSGSSDAYYNVKM